MANSMLPKTLTSLLAVIAFCGAAETSVVVQDHWTAPFEYQYHTVATLKSRYVIEYKAQTEGAVIAILGPGENFEIGDTLVRQSDPLKQLALEQSQLLSRELEARRDLSQLQVDHLDALVSSNTVSPQQAQARRLTLVESQAAFEAQNSHAKLLQQSLALLATHAVKPGSVVEQRANIGEFVEKGAPLLTTVDMTAVQYWLALPLEHAAQINEQTRIVALAGKVSLPVSTVIPSGKTSVSVLTSEFDMSNHPIGHLATQPVTVLLRGETPLHWFHRDGVVEHNGLSQVNVIDSQAQVVARNIVIAAEKGPFVGVTGTLVEGDRIILRGMDNLDAQSDVRIVGDRTDDLKKQFADVGTTRGERQL